MKFKQKKGSKVILSDKIADALTVKPRADIEDDEIFHSKPNTVSRGDFSSSDSEDDAAISNFRKQNVNLLSEISKKYEGRVVSRKELHAGSSQDESSSEADLGNNDENEPEVQSDEDSKEDSEDSSITNNVKKLIESSDESDGAENSYNDEEDDEENDEDGYDISEMEAPMKEEFEHVKKQNISEEAKKGNCVRNQLLIWEGLLEMRIHLQRCINTANMMPMCDTFNELKSSPNFNDETSVTINNVATVLDKFMSLQELLLKKFPETKSISNSKKKSEPIPLKEDSDEEIPSDTDNEEIPSDTEEEDNVTENKKQPKVKTSNKNTQKKRKLQDYESDIATTHKAFKPFRDTTIQKWNEKTRLATAANIKNAPTNTILQQISFILSDRNKLIHRTQLKRSEYDIVGYNRPSQEENNDQNGVNPVSRDRKDNDEYIPEIFDDSDFYHQLLRELIECKSADISDPIQLSRQWIALQQMRSKMKRKVDTRATKGRKIKYVVHNQLVSYMAPEKSVNWNDESCNELYSSLFGKMFEHNNVGINVNLENVTIKD